MLKRSKLNVALARELKLDPSGEAKVVVAGLVATVRVGYAGLVVTTFKREAG